MVRGFVSLVGAGPGDPELLTLKAVRCLAEADVVLFDDLAAGPMLSHCRADAELIAVGKRAGRASPKQGEIDRLLVDHALGGSQVVRLKSGDPGIFGRLEEEIVALEAAGIAYEIVPGVSAASAAAAAAGIPLTRRNAARRVQFVTGHDVTGALPADRNMAALADAGATTVVFMPKRTFPALAEALIAHGLSPQTPALMAEHVGCPDQRLTRSTVGDLAAQLSEGVSDKAALILYGPLMEDL
ncbi:uroporphyrinogen-III C-methyltransferase [Sphingomonas sp. SORGH_AS_0879]|uniref:uroporphyrinogen-III C-methyltransferase n=1 Tax=Sphingomonas sp. SORGH_AS_0879 TaxID=3041790 RepID=UPI0027877FA9|nr:uroporphyrinogen-III C-methyltransferase [Sphingomonas sp. SORGH_AS_0879]MDQ1232005.1 uroporphyrin-III C-methyltransferase [Sphingomonas sp. SORGH_AS_0879]